MNNEIIIKDWTNFVESGKKICLENNFYNTLRLILKYYFIYDKKDINIFDILREVSKNEMEMKVFVVYKNFSIDLYHKIVKDVFKDTFNDIKLFSEDDIIYTLIFFVKQEYDKDHSVIKEYINNIDKDDVIEKFNLIKSNYRIKVETLQKFTKLEEAIKLLEESKILEKKAQNNRNKAISILYSIHNSIDKINYEDIKLLE